MIGEGTGTTFSISLPMQRISAKMENDIAKQPSFRRYINPALDTRVANDLQRSQKSVRVPSASDDSKKSLGFSDQDITPIIPTTQSPSPSLSLHPQEQKQHEQQPQAPVDQPSSLTIASTLPLSGDVLNQMVPIVDAAVDVNNRVVNLPFPRVDNATEKYRILVVDDSALNRKMLTKLLKSKGYNIEEAADGQIAVDKVKQEADAGRTYDVILMDFVMPVMDGPTATRAIRAMHISTPIFGLTGGFDQ
jgi:Response regulator receiver domain